MHGRYTGTEVKITCGDIVGHFNGITINIKKSKYEARASDSDVQQRGTKYIDADIEIKGWDTDLNGGASFSDVAALVMANLAPTALTFTDNGATPATKLPADFFTKFPLSGWSFDEVKGSDWNEKAAEWTLKLTPNNLDLATA